MKRVSCARPVVQTVSDSIEFVLCVDREVGSFGQVLSQQPVGVFTCAALPGTMGVAEVHAHAEGVRFVQPLTLECWFRRYLIARPALCAQSAPFPTWAARSRCLVSPSAEMAAALADR
jgi:hypothetical protein